ncbi:MAG: polysaccharide pyruvyl transferase family protein [Psychroserpens sp.]|uniref:polysaccharide pyruvyl transferase family protein n=1 Tax=Psychroserpens sp. TaxID=2020870 RepID=UPI0030030F00
MKIGILGWYFQNNAGDDRILECLKKKCETLGATEVSVFIAWDELNSKIEEINTCDFLLVGGGGLILRNTNRLVSLFEKIMIPWAFIGVSIDSVGEDNSKFITYISNNAKFIIVRDQFSLDIFRNYRQEALFIAPDLTFLYPFKNDASHDSKNAVAVSLRPWRPNLFKQYTKNYHRFNKLVHKLPIVTTFLRLWDIKKFTKVVNALTTSHIKPFPLHINDVNGDNLLMQTYFDAEKNIAFNIDDLKQSDYLIGMRLHSLIFATQLGVPFVAISYASKIDNYLEDIGLSNFVVNVNNYKALSKKIKQLKAQKETISKQLLQTSHNNEVEVNKVVNEAFKTFVL